MAHALSKSALHDAPLESAPVRKHSLRPWPKWILLFLILLWVVQMGTTLLIRHTRLQRRLTASLGAAFGRPVEVGKYDFSLWGGPCLVAEHITVGEDPRFGHEYFLRAESLTVRLRRKSLFRGRLELGTLSLTRPSLNLVRSSDGNWNLAEWLSKPPSPPAARTRGAPAEQAVVRFGRIEIDSGRINFKQGDDKLPFAFVNVQGYVEQEAPGRWRMDLQSRPARAAIVLQQVGTLRLLGHVGGTSSRLRPATLELSWKGASISDVLRLARDYDYGTRGTLALTLAARTEGATWALQGYAELRQLHRWDLALRPDNPSFNLVAKGTLDPRISRLEVADAILESRRSNARAEGAIEWNHARGFPAGQRKTQIQIVSPWIDGEDVLAWLRAFRSDVAGDVSLRGGGQMEMRLSGWPPRLEAGVVTSGGMELTGGRLAVPVRLDRAAFRYSGNVVTLSPMTLAFGSPASSFRVEASARPGRDAPSNLRVAGGMNQVRELISAAESLGWNISRGWDIAGSVRCDLRWQGTHFPWQIAPVGSVEWGGESGGLLRTPFLNQPIEQIRARLEVRPGARHIELDSAQAFGASWKGSLDFRDAIGRWQVLLVVDRLDAGDLDRWLDPRWRESWLDRALPFLNPRSPSNAVPENFRAMGRMNVDRFTLGPLLARRMETNLSLEGRRLRLFDAKAQFYGGGLDGSFEANLQAAPEYRAGLDFSNVDLRALSAAAPQLEGIFAGAASGEISFHARGAGRDPLLASLECQGTARIRQAEWRSLNLPASLWAAHRRPGTTMFPDASAAFTCGNSRIDFQDLHFLAPGAELTATGSVDYRRNLDMRLWLLSSESARKAVKRSRAPGEAYRLAGTLTAPQVSRLTLKGAAH